MLAQANLWSDIIGFAIILMGIGMPFMLLGVNILMGRFQERFIKYHWHLLEVIHLPWEEEHPLPIRYWHWINLSCFVIFFASGIYIRYPYFIGGREFMRYIHIFAGYVATINIAVRLKYMFTSNDWKNFTYSKKDIPVLIQVMMYYGGIRKSYDHIAKYHPMQRGSYIAIYAMLIPQAYTGFALMWPKIFLLPVAGFLGGMANAAAWTRFIHSSIWRFYILLIAGHASLSLYEGWPSLKYFWFGIKDPLPNAHPSGHGHDDHGDSHGDEHGHGGGHGDPSEENSSEQETEVKLRTGRSKKKEK